MYKIIIILLVFIILYIIYNNQQNNKIEGYFDILPYDFHWEMFKCLDMECLKKKTKKCYDACSVHVNIRKIHDVIDTGNDNNNDNNNNNNNYNNNDNYDMRIKNGDGNSLETGGVEHCRMRCMDYADQYAQQLKLNNILWNRILPKFEYAALYRKAADYH